MFRVEKKQMNPTYKQINKVMNCQINLNLLYIAALFLKDRECSECWLVQEKRNAYSES